MLKERLKDSLKTRHILNDSATYMVFKSGTSARCSVCFAAHHLFPSSHHGFRYNHSTDTAFLLITDHVFVCYGPYPRNTGMSPRLL